MMRIALKVLGYVLGLAILLAGGALGYVLLALPQKTQAAPLRIERTPERLARGEYLVRLADCDGCHSERDFTRFDGPVVPRGRLAGVEMPKEMGLPGTVSSANITPDAETGIGTWTDGEIVRAIREGVDKDGRTLFPMMPYESFRNMADEDVYSVVAYLRTIAPVKRYHPKPKLDFPASLMINLTPKPAGTVPPPDVSTKLKRGKYLVTIAGCQGCHTATLAGGDKFGFPGVTVVSANITPDTHAGIGKLSEQDFVNKFAQYRDYVANGSPKAGLSSFTVMPWLQFCQLPDDDLRAIYTYIHTFPPVNKPVETHPGFDKGLDKPKEKS